MSEEVMESEVENINGVEVVEVDEPTPNPDDINSLDVEDAVEVSSEPAEKKEEEEELVEYSSKVQKRINTLTRKLREEERAKASALNYAEEIKQENEKLKGSKNVSEQNYLVEAEARLNSQRTQATKALTDAQVNQDYEKVAKATDILAKIAVEENKITSSKKELEYQNTLKEEDAYKNSQIQRQVQNTSPPQVDEKAQEWAEKNEWFGQDQIMTLAAFSIHKNLTEEEGFDPRSNEYYTEVNNRMKKEFPLKFEDSSNVTERPQQRVASAARADSKSVGKRQVKLTPAEVQMAKRLNVPLTEYAKFVKR
tara:strand:+ start:10590 stop:11519 length:930 start_codon:yes stop_codon:yes gene_type:complete